MSEHLRYLGQHSRVPIACLPNAGLPSVVEGQMHYDLTPRPAGRVPEPLRRATSACRWWAAAAAPPSSTSPPLVDAVKDVTPAPRHFEHEDGATSIYSFTPFEQQLTYLSIGERTNANGSKKFREAMLEGDWDMCVAMAREQEKEGAHVLDVCVDYVGRDGTRRHGRDRVALRHPGHRPADDRLHRAAGHRDGPAVDRRPGHPQLGQPRGRRRAGHPARPLPVAGPRVRRRRRLHLHRRGGPGPHARVEAQGRQGHPRHRRRPLRPRARRPVLRPARPHPRHGHGGEPGRRRLHPRGHPAHQGAPARRAHHARPVEHLLRPQPGRPPRPQLRLPARGGPGRPRLGHRPRRPHHAPRPDPRGAEAGLPRRHLRPAHRRLRPAAGAALDVRGREAPATVEKEDRSDWTIERVLSTRIIDGDRDGLTADLDVALDGRPHAAGDHQRHPPRGHEGGRRPLRQGRDAAAVRAAVGRDDEGGRRLPRADDGQGRRRVHQGPHRAGHREGRRPRHRQEPRRHHPHQQRLRGAQPRHQGERRRDGRQGRRGEGRRHRHERPAREEHADHAREPRGAEHPRPGRDPGAPRRRRPHARVRRARPPRGLRGPPLLRQGRLRGPPRHGSHRLHQARRHRRRPRLGPGAHRLHHRAPAAASPSRAPRTTSRSTSPPAPPRWPPTTRCSRRRSSAARS